mmetsp:Transcript_82/g.357  ORF Transcript_82/g.357 Transcript_82/m.357 type:complete len:256 (+) Transcript_82:17-784(+)
MNDQGELIYGALSEESVSLVKRKDRDRAIQQPSLRAIVWLLCLILIGLLCLLVLAASTLIHIRGHLASPASTATNLALPALLSQSYTATSHEKCVVLIVYLPNDEGQLQMASHIAKGVESVDGMAPVVQTVTDTSFENVLNASAVILGSSVENGNIHPQLQSWINEDWDIRQSDLTSSKIGAAFVTAGGISAGQESTLGCILRAFLIFRFIIVGGETWTAAFGASAVTHEAPFMTHTDAIAEGDDFLTPCATLMK